jgi:hypothetical protein
LAIDVAEASVDLLWIPLGIGDRVVRLSGSVYEGLLARWQGRPPRDLYHSALKVAVPTGGFTIEVTPVADHDGAARGVVKVGSVGLKVAGHLRIFRYEIRRWKGGVISDEAAAIAGPIRIAHDLARAQMVLDLTPSVPPLVWGRDQRHTGEMWNSNSVTAWLLECAGIDTDGVPLPRNGRVPGWASGLAVARRRAEPSASLVR